MELKPKLEGELCCEGLPVPGQAGQGQGLQNPHGQVLQGIDNFL